MIFVDSDAYIGIYFPKDPHHKKAVALVDELKRLQEELVTSWETIDEVATKLSFLSTKEIASRFLRDRRQSDEKIVFVDESLSEAIIGLFLKQRSKRVSLTDCANMAIARKLGIEIFLSFDNHYCQNGFKLFGD